MGWAFKSRHIEVLLYLIPALLRSAEVSWQASAEGCCAAELAGRSLPENVVPHSQRLSSAPTRSWRVID